nr:transposase zinc-binding domain-containing protein [Enterococcus avium]
MKPNILHAIFFDEYQNWEKFNQRYTRRIRSVVKREVKKFRDCGDLKKGYRLFVCEGCHDVKKVAFRCKGKFCPTCATGKVNGGQRLRRMICLQ